MIKYLIFTVIFCTIFAGFLGYHFSKKDTCQQNVKNKFILSTALCGLILSSVISFGAYLTYIESQQKLECSVKQGRIVTVEETGKKICMNLDKYEQYRKELEGIESKFKNDKRELYFKHFYQIPLETDK